MKESICIWDGCKEKIKLDDSFENSSPGQNLGVVVSGWCDFHSRVYAKQVELFDKLDSKKHHSDIANYLYLHDRKKYNKISKQAEKLVREDLKN